MKKHLDIFAFAVLVAILAIGCAKIVHAFAGTNDLGTTPKPPTPVLIGTWTNGGMIYQVWSNDFGKGFLHVWEYSASSGEFLGLKQFTNTEQWRK